MAELTPKAKDRALKRLFDEGGTVGLSRHDAEIADVGYVAQALVVGEPRPVRGDVGVRALANKDIIRFGPWSEDAPDAVTGWVVMDALGDLMATGRFEERKWPRRGDEIVIHPGDLVLGQK